jgi:hypothetical protein
MPENSNLLLAPMARKLDQHRRLDEADRDAILNLPASLRRLEAGQYLSGTAIGRSRPAF